jgi:hypothetical protein
MLALAQSAVGKVLPREIAVRHTPDRDKFARQRLVFKKPVRPDLFRKDRNSTSRRPLPCRIRLLCPQKSATGAISIPHVFSAPIAFPAHRPRPPYRRRCFIDVESDEHFYARVKRVFNVVEHAQKRIYTIVDKRFRFCFKLFRDVDRYLNAAEFPISTAFSRRSLSDKTRCSSSTT